MLNYAVLQDLGCCVSTPEYSVPPLPEQYVCNSIVIDVGSTVYLLYTSRSSRAAVLTYHSAQYYVGKSFYYTASTKICEEPESEGFSSRTDELGPVLC